LRSAGERHLDALVLLPLVAIDPEELVRRHFDDAASDLALRVRHGDVIGGASQKQHVPAVARKRVRPTLHRAADHLPLDFGVEKRSVAKERFAHFFLPYTQLLHAGLAEIRSTRYLRTGVSQVIQRERSES